LIGQTRGKCEGAKLPPIGSGVSIAKTSVATPRGKATLDRLAGGSSNPACCRGGHLNPRDLRDLQKGRRAPKTSLFATADGNGPDRRRSGRVVELKNADGERIERTAEKAIDRSIQNYKLDSVGNFSVSRMGIAAMFNVIRVGLVVGACVLALCNATIVTSVSVLAEEKPMTAREVRALVGKTYNGSTGYAITLKKGGRWETSDGRSGGYAVKSDGQLVFEGYPFKVIRISGGFRLIRPDGSIDADYLVKK
jgi:hypothetical protein